MFDHQLKSQQHQTMTNSSQTTKKNSKKSYSALQYKQNNQLCKLQVHHDHGHHGHDARHGH